MGDKNQWELCRICGERTEEGDISDAGVCWDCEQYHGDEGAERILALAEIEGLDADDLEISKYDDALVECGRMEWLVLDDEDADNRAKRLAESYAEELLFGAVPERYHAYVDTDRFILDTVQQDGRASLLASYDGSEWGHHDPYTGRDWFIFRVN